MNPLDELARIQAEHERTVRSIDRSEWLMKVAVVVVVALPILVFLVVRLLR